MLITIKVMLHRAILNNDFEHNTAMQCWNNVVTIQNNVATIMHTVVSCNNNNNRFYGTFNLNKLCTANYF